LAREDNGDPIGKRRQWTVTQNSRWEKIGGGSFHELGPAAEVSKENEGRNVATITGSHARSAVTSHAPRIERASLPLDQVFRRCVGCNVVLQPPSEITGSRGRGCGVGCEWLSGSGIEAAHGCMPPAALSRNVCHVRADSLATP